MKQKRETLLIVDDSRFQRAVFGEMLHEFFDIIEAASGEECLDLVKHSNGKINLILLDLVMPGVDGFEVLRRRTQMEEFRNIPVIVLTTSESEAVHTTAFELGANEFIIKPVERTIALSRIHNVLETQRRLRSILEEQERLRIRAEIDEMTNLCNKTTSERLIKESLHIAPEQQHALFLIDIDNFKAVNDVYGHEMGDHTICVVAGVLSSTFSKDDLIGRLGGDEFVVLMRGVASKETAYQKAEEVLWAIRDKESLSIPENVTISMGLAFSEGQQTDYETLFHQADEALYSSKKDGKNCCSEYGVMSEVSGSAHTVLVFSRSRNVSSMLSFAYPPSADIQVISDIGECAQMDMRQVLAFYVDVSDLADDGSSIWEKVTHALSGEQTPVIAVCAEGNMQQVKHAVMTEQVQDILYAPLEAANLKRRVKANMRTN